MNSNKNTFKADLDALLTPISTERLAGDSLLYEPIYDHIKEARREDDASLSQGIYVAELKKADWSLVEELCTDALAARSKDLQLAAWLMEAWIHLHGFVGAREGLILVRGLVEGFWEDLYPQQEDGDAEARLTPFEWIDNRLSVSLKQLPITLPDVGDLQAYSFVDRERVDRDAALSKKDRQDAGSAKDADRITHARFLTSVTMTPSVFFQELYGAVSETIRAAEALEKVLTAKWGKSLSLLYQIRGVLGTIQEHAVQVLQEREEEVQTGLTSISSAEGDKNASFLAPARPNQIRSRADAYRMLLEAAEYLAKTEPHSPTPYLVRRAVSWGGMTLVELMQELVQGQSDLTFIYELLGMREGS